MKIKAPTHLMLSAATAVALLAGIGCGDNSTSPGDSDTITAVFRDGASPLPTYTGTRDAVIKNGPGYAAQSGNYGTRDVDTLGIIDIDGSLYEQRMLVKFDLTSITDCGTLASAVLTINVTPADTNHTIWLDAYGVTVPATYPKSWIEGFLNTGVTWLTVDGNFDWTTAGGDLLDLMVSREVRADTVVTFELDAVVVGSWIKTPWINHGILLRPRTAGEAAFLYAYMRESATAALRPELYIKYIKGG
ncbi:MAG: hypothetical protein KAU49_04705 [Candidatus Krumholzibacteria bacterium]|nr:hypothetical protein [Candidatus Krumholzibacteria bacterium]